ncbi:hypothetical protein BpHYR1_006813 [Brachionus plicatilis]|uniref:Uncharacterized protein n=1 Tax=Brachionus plicatilis TaxID=10195 RepID=A0A3M7S8Q0_BRAPC|nr:hypothetical protein BpHYR1_006813 [Brachionus plicatilis]
MARDALEDESITREELTKERFIRGLKDHLIKEKLCNQFNLSLGEMGDLARKWESKNKKMDTIATPKINLKHESNCELKNTSRLFQLTQGELLLTPLKGTKAIRGLCRLEDKLVASDFDTRTDVSAISALLYYSLYPRPELVKSHHDVFPAGGKMENVNGLVRVGMQFEVENLAHIC